jgi:ferredoxin
VEAAGDAAGDVEPLHHPVQRHGVRHDVGLPVPDICAGSQCGNCRVAHVPVCGRAP